MGIFSQKIESWNNSRISLQRVAICSITGLQFSSLEVAPTMYGSWEELFSGTVKIPLQPVAMQSLLFGKQHEIYSTLFSWLEHMNGVAKLARSLNCPYLVFGSPASRRFPDRLLNTDRGFSAAELYISGALSDLADSNTDIIFALEANPKEYGANTATNTNQASRIVRLANRPNIRFHPDTGCLRLAGDDPASVLEQEKDIISRCHVSMPHLKCYNGSESLFIEKAIHYGFGISYEARPETGAEDAAKLFFSDIERAIT